MNNALILRLGTDIEPARKAIATLATQAVPALAAIGATAITASRGILATGTSLSSIGGALSTGLELFTKYKIAMLAIGVASSVVTGAVAAAVETIARLNAIAAGAKDAGVSATFFQTWARQAQDFGIAAKEAEQALIHARDAVKSKAGAQFANLNTPTDILGELALGPGKTPALGAAYSAFTNSNSVEERIKAIVAAIRELNRVAQETGNGGLNLIGDKLATQAFGSDKFADAIRSAKTDMAALQAAGLSTGTIFSDALVAKAKDLEDRLRAAHQVLADEMAPTMQVLASLGLDIKDHWVDLVELFAKAVVNADGLVAKLSQIPHISPPAWMKILGVVTSTGYDAVINGPTKPTALNAGQRAVAAGLDPSKIAWPAIPGAGAPDQSQYAGVLPPVRPPPSVLNATSSPAARGGRSSGGGTDSIETFIDSLKKQVDTMKAEVETYGKSNKVKQEAIQLAGLEAAARRQGTTATRAQRDAVLKEADAIAVEKDKLEQVQRATEQAKEAAQFFGNAMVDAIERMTEPGAKAKDVLAGIVQMLEKAAIQSLILGQGPLAGLFGTASSTSGGVGGIFGWIASAIPKFADGGMVPGSMDAPTLAVVHGGEVVLNRAQQGALASTRSGAPITYAPTTHVYANGLSAAQAQTMIDRSNAKIVPSLAQLQKRTG